MAGRGERPRGREPNVTDRDIFVELTLQLAQNGREPSAADESRNLAALRSRLGLPGASANARLTSASAAEAPLAQAPSSVPVRAPRASRGLWRLVGASTFTGVAGFVLGLVLAPGLRSELAETPDGARAPEVFALADETPDARESSPIRAIPTVTSTPTVTADEVRAEPTAPVAASASTEPIASTEPPAKRAAPPRGRATSKKSSTTNGPDFLEAVRWLRRAQRAVRRGEGALALGLLGELDGRFPPEVLGEERQATRVLGLCGTGDDDRAQQLARELLAKSPRSIYAERLRASCAASAIGGDAKKNDLEGRE